MQGYISLLQQKQKEYHPDRFISDLSCSASCGWAQYAGIHGGGSPVMEKIGIRSQYDLESKKRIVEDLAGIKD